ncbi:hypothetical protein [Arthrobacter sp. ISL-5]|uniref:hypothetical protein n=1 Tax=Arthrobacter sp. ISL-5 TaxID=2819111 RepID=UPI001BEB9978|nr:hypothetical protein [Arthrobacter sp. ISL-5]MBT2552767.1 Hpt domain-containing protein [Arthrobacter sp. ISL-5]
MSTPWRDIAGTGIPAIVQVSGASHRQEGQQDGGSLPVLDRAPIRFLADEAGPGAAQKFLEDYLGLLPARAAAIIDGLNSEDREKTLDALVSLGVSSAMAGASRVEYHARNLQRQVQSGHWPDATSAKALLSQAILQIKDATVGPVRPG